MKETLSVVIITKNEEKNIEECLQSVSWADEIVVVDSGSTDRTVEICRRYHAKIHEHSIDQGLNFNKNLGNDRAAGNWILSLDADERVSPELADEIQQVLENPGEAVAYRMPRRNYFLGKWIRSAGWYPDLNIRLFRKGKASWKKKVHEVIESSGPVADLKGAILHYSYRTLDDYFRKFNLYTSILAGEEWEEGKRVTPLNFLWHFVLNPLQVFLRKYFWMGGWRDGARGLFISFSASLVVVVTAAKIWEKQLQ